MGVAGMSGDAARADGCDVDARGQQASVFGQGARQCGVFSGSRRAEDSLGQLTVALVTSGLEAQV
jgi:hypothetical protein